MADNIIKRFIQLFVNSDDAVSGLKKTEKALGDVDKATSKVEQSTKDLNESAKRAEKGIGGLGKGFNLLGNAIKGIGIGIGLKIFEKLTEIFLGNQKVVDALAIAMNVLKVVFNDLFKLIENNIGTVVKRFKEIFSDPKKAVIDFGNAIKNSLIESFNSLIKSVGFLATAVKKFFTGDYKGAIDAAKKGTKEFVDVLTGVDGSFDKISTAVGNTVDSLTTYIEEAIKTAEANVELQKSSEKAIIINQGLIEKYDALAERLRQVRDDDTNSISVRIAANDKLGLTLDKQSALMIKNGELVLKAAKNNYELSRTHENQLKILEAQNALAEITARIEGQRSEQISNRISLTKELNNINDTASDRDAARDIERLKFLEEVTKDEFDRFILIEQRLAREQELNDEKLEKDKERYKEGTQARVDAEQDYLDKKQELDAEEVRLSIDRNAAIEKGRRESLNQFIDDEKDTFKNRLDALKIQDEEIQKATSLSEEERTEMLRENAEKRILLEEMQVEARDKMLSRISASLNEAAQVLGENTAAGKAAAIAATTIDTYRSATAAYAGMVESIPGPPGIVAGFAAAAISVAAGLMNVKKILAVKTKGGGGDSSALSGGGTTGQPAQFNIIGSSQTNQFTQAINTGRSSQVLKAQVVGSEVSTQQALDRNRVEQSVFL